MNRKDNSESLIGWFLAIHPDSRKIRFMLITLLGAYLWIFLGFASISDRRIIQMDYHLALRQVSYIGQVYLKAIFNKIPEPEPLTGEESKLLIFELPFRILFTSSDALRHILLAGYVFWLVLKVTTVFVKETFGLGETSAGMHFLLQSALINPYATKEADSSRKEDEREQLQGEIQQLENEHKKIAIVTDYFSRLVEDYDTQKGKAKKTIKPSAAS